MNPGLCQLGWNSWDVHPIIHQIGGESEVFTCYTCPENQMKSPIIPLKKQYEKPHVQQLCLSMFLIFPVVPSGYVNIAIENGHVYPFETWVFPTINNHVSIDIYSVVII